jgi:chitodextrinase
VWDATAANERFCVIAAVTPQIMQCKLASYYPAGSSVEAATTQSRRHVRCKWWTCHVPK